MGPGAVLFYCADMETALVSAEPALCLIDSDPAVRDSVGGLVSLFGHPVLCFANAWSFLGEIDRLRVRGVICEATLPDTTGVDVFRVLVDHGLHVPFALLVSRRMAHVEANARRLGIDLVLYKPILDFERLLAFIRHEGPPRLR